MNKPNNKRKKESQEKIERAFIELIQTKNVEEVTVTDICNLTHLNRSTFYANYLDIYDLIDKIKIKMIEDFFDIYKDETSNQYHSYDFLKLFHHINENQLFYKTYFKLNFDLTDSVKYIDSREIERFHADSKNIDYHIEFFKAGLNAILKKWLNSGCKESPEEIVNILRAEYTKKELP
jgi:AcrR family transcriptional regulator